MKNSKNRIIGMLFIAVLMGLNINVFAQRGYGQRNLNRQGDFNGAPQRGVCNFIPDLTQEQQDEIQQLRTSHLQNVQEEKNILAEKRTRLHSLRTSQNPNMGEINKVIEEMGDIRTSLQKEREEHIQNVRNVLTEEQRVYFDSRRGNAQGFRRGYGRRGGNCYGYGQGRGFGQGRGYGAGRGNALN